MQVYMFILAKYEGGVFDEGIDRKDADCICSWNCIRFIVADRYYPSSKTCSECGYILDKLSLSTRKWVCPECGIIHDRDINAAINLMKYGKSA